MVQEFCPQGSLQVPAFTVRLAARLTACVSLLWPHLQLPAYSRSSCSALRAVSAAHRHECTLAPPVCTGLTQCSEGWSSGAQCGSPVEYLLQHCCNPERRLQETASTSMPLLQRAVSSVSSAPTGCIWHALVQLNATLCCTSGFNLAASSALQHAGPSQHVLPTGCI